MTPQVVKQILGVEKTSNNFREKITEPGIAAGMAVTSIGGRIIYVEAAISPGNGKIELTGHLGAVMKESVISAVSWLKSNLNKFNLTRYVNSQGASGQKISSQNFFSPTYIFFSN